MREEGRSELCECAGECASGKLPVWPRNVILRIFKHGCWGGQEATRSEARRGHSEIVRVIATARMITSCTYIRASLFLRVPVYVRVTRGSVMRFHSQIDSSVVAAENAVKMRLGTELN